MHLLDIKPIKQQTKQSCGSTCVIMLSSFFSYDYNKVINGKLNIFDLANELPTNLNTFIQFYNYTYFDDKFNDINPNSRINFVKNINSLDHIDNKLFESMIKALEKGVFLVHKIISIEDIEGAIKNKSPVIVLVSVREFRCVKLDKWRGHFVLIKGFDDNYFYYNDPHWDDKKFGEHKIEKEHLLLSIAKTKMPAILWIKYES